MLDYLLEYKLSVCYNSIIVKKIETGDNVMVFTYEKMWQLVAERE